MALIRQHFTDVCTPTLKCERRQICNLCGQKANLLEFSLVCLRDEKMGVSNVLWLSWSFGGNYSPCHWSKAIDSVGSSIHRSFPKPGPGSPVVQTSLKLIVSAHLWGGSASSIARHTDNGCGCSVQWMEVKAVLIPLASTLPNETCISPDLWPVATGLAIWSATCKL